MYRFGVSSHFQDNLGESYEITTWDLSPKSHGTSLHHRHALPGGGMCQWGSGTSVEVGGGTSVGVAFSLGGWLWSLLGWWLVGGMPKVWSLVKHRLLQYNFAPISKTGICVPSFAASKLGLPKNRNLARMTRGKLEGATKSDANTWNAQKMILEVEEGHPVTYASVD